MAELGANPAEEELLQREIEIDPYQPGPANVRLRRTGTHVWAIIGHYRDAVHGDEAAIARDYELTSDELKAALLYYRRHRPEIDGRLADNRPIAAS